MEQLDVFITPDERDDGVRFIFDTAKENLEAKDDLNIKDSITEDIFINMFINNDGNISNFYGNCKIESLGEEMINDKQHVHRFDLGSNPDNFVAILKGEKNIEKQDKIIELATNGKEVNYEGMKIEDLQNEINKSTFIYSKFKGGILRIIDKAQEHILNKQNEIEGPEQE